MAQFKYTTNYVKQLSQEELFAFFKSIDFPLYEPGFWQGYRYLDMKDGTTAFFSFNSNINRKNFIFIHDFEIRAKNTTSECYYGIHQLHHNKKILVKYFKMMLAKFDSYYQEAKLFWQNHNDILKILEKAHFQLDCEKQDVESDL
ncbi:MAG: hypothetical protein E7379_01730 [Clostridiales bacterium]|nr:hypothetical protein [Clostridiales bacterium]